MTKPIRKKYTSIIASKGKAKIVVPAKSSFGATVSLNIRAPEEVVARLKDLTEGPHSVAAFALIEMAMDILENTPETWTVSVSPQRLS